MSIRKLFASQVRRCPQRQVRLEKLDPRQLMAGDFSGWHNQASPGDVNVDSTVTELDALLVINQISKLGGSGHTLSEQSIVPQSLKVDVNNDAMLSALDALLAINQVSSRFESTVAIESIERLDSSAGEFHFLLRGSATPGRLVEIRQNGFEPVGQTLADSGGNWELTLIDVTLMESRFQFTAVELSADGTIVGQSDSKSFQPNIVLVNTDDMRFEQTRFMPFLEQLQQQSTVFESAYVPTSVSGPSRASLMSGLFAASHGYLNNAPTLGTSINEDRTTGLPVWLSDAGYRTGLFGKDRTQPKVEERFESQDILAPWPGWDDYFAGVSRGNNGFNVGFSDNGVLVEAGSDIHLTDVIRNEVIEFIDQTPDGVPFFAYVAPTAPHSPGIPSHRNQGVYSDVEVPRGPAFEFDESIEGSEGFLDMIAQQYRGGSEALLDVDEAMESIVGHLDDNQTLDNTVIIFTSDNGRGVGEHGIFYKNKFWEESIRVPLVVFDGRAPVGQTTDALAALPDLTGTVLDLGNAVPDETIEGVSLVPVLNTPDASVREDFLIQQVYESSGQLQREFGVHTGSHVYVETTFPIKGQTRFLFDLDSDPFQLTNLVGDADASQILFELDSRLEELRGTDREAPILTSSEWVVSGTEYLLPQTLTLIAHVSDIDSGGSEIRTPALINERWTSVTYGTPLEALDGLFDDAVESTVVELSIDDLAGNVTPGTFYLRTRDVIGNIGSPIRLRAPLDPPPVLDSASDTGESPSDRITVDSSPTFFGHGLPGERVALFTSGDPDQPDPLLGTAVVGAEGRWEISAELTASGEHAVYAQIGSPADEPEPTLRITAPVEIYLAAFTSGSEVTVLGTDRSDSIVVTEKSGGAWQIQFNGVDAGMVPAADRLTINGSVGDDYLEVVGGIRSRLLGSSGDDELVGGVNTDVLIGGRGRNILSGGLGNDIYQFSYSDKILESELITPGLRDVVLEKPGEGVDRIRFIGNFSVDARFDQHAPSPQVILQPDFDYTRQIEIVSPLAIERIEGSVQDSMFRLQANQSFFGGAGNDLIEIVDAVPAGHGLSLAVLRSGGDANDAIDLLLSATGGTLTLAVGEIPASVSVESISQTSLSLSGPRGEINDVLEAGHVQWIADSGSVGPASVVATSSLQTSSNLPTEAPQPQIDTLDVNVRRVIEFSGVTDELLTESGINLRVFSSFRFDEGGENFAGATLSFELTQGMQTRDALLLLGQIDGPNSITVDGQTISFGGTIIGQMQPRDSIFGPLSIQLNGNATHRAVEAMIRRLAFRNLSTDSSTPIRQLRLNLTTGQGEILVVSKSVRVDRPLASEPPTLEFQDTDPLAYQTQNPRFISLGSTSAVKGDDSTSFSRLTVDLIDPIHSGSEIRLLSGIVRSLPHVHVDLKSGIVFVEEAYAGNIISESSQRIELSLSRFATEEIVVAILKRFQYRNESATDESPDQIVRFELSDSNGLTTGPVDRVIQFQ